MTIMSSLSRELLEHISEWSEALAAVFGILAAISVVVYLLANKPIRKLEARDMELLHERVAIADGKVAGLEKHAADAKTEMSKQQTRAAKAEQDLLALQQRTAPRRVSKEQAAKFMESFDLRKQLHGPHIRITSMPGCLMQRILLVI
jgi:hypothetical protein